MLRSCNKDLVQAVAKALHPDNEKPPPNFRISCVIDSNDCTLTYLIERIGRGELTKDLLTLLSIIDEISRLSEAVEMLIKNLDTSV